MKILHISDHALGLSYPILVDKPENLVKSIFEAYSYKNLFLINVNYNYDNISHSENAGILLLKYLRLYHLNQHCVLYSFLSREQLMIQNPQNAILFSKGVTFIRLPKKLDTINFEFLINKKAPEDLSDYFKAEFRLPDNRHFFANWWGMLQLWKVHKAVEKIAGSTVIKEIESDFKGSLNEMYSYQGLVARYIKKVADPNIEHHLKILINRKVNDFKDEECRKSKRKIYIDELYVKDYEYEIQLNLLDETLTESQNTVLKKLLDNVIGFSSSIQNKIGKIKAAKDKLGNDIIHEKAYLTLISQIKKEKELVYDKRRKLNREIISIINEIAHNKCFSTDGFNPFEIRKKLIEKNPKIVFVDDQAGDGWAAIFQRIIYGGNNENLTTIQPKKTDTIEEISSTIINTVKAINADLLILDLRLQGETGNYNQVDDISGFKVLVSLKEKQINCPILITSASNKIWSYKETLNFGANAYWMKEGLDNNVDFDYSVENYLLFIDLVYTLSCSSEFNFLYKVFLKNINQIKQRDTTLWWESKFWGEDDLFNIESNGKIDVFEKSKITKKETVADLLNVSFAVFETYLNQKIQQRSNTTLDNSLSTVIIIQCFRVLEHIHNFDKIDNNIDRKSVV